MRVRDWVTVVSGASAAAAAVLAVGGALRWSQALVAGLVGLALVGQLMSRRVLGRVSPLVAALGVAAGLTLLSLVPLPQFLLEALDPVGAALRADGSALIGSSPWSALTRDAPGSLRALAFFLILLGVAFLALRFAASERGRYRILFGVGAVCALTALVVGIHELLGATRLYGVYQPVGATPNVLGPLLNENHLGSLMALGTCVTIGLAMYPRQPSKLRVAWIVAVAVCAAATAASGSRGSLIALGAGVVVTGGILLAQKFTILDQANRRRRGSFATSSLPIGVVAICVVIVVVYSSGGKVTRDLDRTSVTEIHRSGSKFAAWKSAETMIRESPWVGVGRGGFEPSFTRVHPSSGSFTFSHVENEYIQAVVDWGIPGTLALAAIFAWLVTVALKRWRDSSLAAGALGALGAIALQSTVDFGVELLGVAVPVTAIAATLAYVPLREVQGRALAGARLTRVVLVAALVGAGALLLSSATTTIDEDHARLSESRSPSIDEIREALERHPFDYYGFSRAALVLARTGDPASVRLLNHALRLHPTHPDLHRIAARLLLRSGHADQAAVEYAIAIRSTAEPQRLIEEIAKVLSPAQAASAIPTDYPQHDIILKALEQLNRSDVATLWLTRVVRAHPTSARTCNRLYELLLGTGDLQAAEAAGRHCVDLMPDQHMRMSLGRVLFGKKAYGDAIRMLEDVETWQGLISDKVEGWLLLCDARMGLERWDEAIQCLRRLEATGFVPAERQADIRRRLDQIAQRRREIDLGSGAAAGSGSGGKQ